MSDSVQCHRWQPTRIPCPWDSPGKNAGVGCHFLLQCMKAKSESEVAQSCPTLSDPMDCSLPGSSIHGIFQVRVLKWVAIAFFIIGKPYYGLLQDIKCSFLCYIEGSYCLSILHIMLCIRYLNMHLDSFCVPFVSIHVCVLMMLTHLCYIQL